MRMRFKPYARPELAAWANFIDDPQKNRGAWAAAYQNPALPLRLELGCGKGGFLARLALRDIACNFLGVDIKSEMLVVAKRNIERLYAETGPAGDAAPDSPAALAAPAPCATQPPNVLLCAHNIEHLSGILAPPDEIDRIYINFCNPWTKTGHAKHRLTHPRQLVQMRDFLRPEGEVWFKTDNAPLFEDSLRYFEHTGFSVEWLSRDLHADEPGWNIRTEHEEMFSAEGIPIKACIAKMQPARLDRQAIARLKDF